MFPPFPAVPTQNQFPAPQKPAPQQGYGTAPSPPYQNQAPQAPQFSAPQNQFSRPQNPPQQAYGTGPYPQQGQPTPGPPLPGPPNQFPRPQNPPPQQGYGTAPSPQYPQHGQSPPAPPFSAPRIQNSPPQQSYGTGPYPQQSQAPQAPQFSAPQNHFSRPQNPPPQPGYGAPPSPPYQNQAPQAPSFSGPQNPPQQAYGTGPYPQQSQSPPGPQFSAPAFSDPQYPQEGYGSAQPYQNGFTNAPSPPGMGAGPPQMNNNMFFNNQQSARFVDLMVERNLLGFDCDDNQFELPQVMVNPEVHCSPSYVFFTLTLICIYTISRIFRSTMAAVPETQELMNKCRLPLGLTLQPFRDLKNLTVIQTNIVRCKYCRTYINPYVYMPDNRRWKCNLCYRVNDLPEEFTWDPQSRTFGDPSRRPEIQQPTIEYIAPSEYMLRAPQPVLYLFVFDVSSTAVDCGFIGVDAAIHFFQFNDPSAPPKHLVAYDIEEPFAPVSTGLVVELVKYKESIRSFVQNLPTFFETNSCSSNCLGAALTIGRDLIQEVGGRITVMLASIPNIGPGALNVSQDASSKGSKLNFGTSTDFYKRLALECTGKQIAVDLFVMGERHVDIATLSEVVKFSTGSVYHFPHYHFIREQTEVKRFQKLLNRYLTRKLGLEAVLRIRCLSLHTFHGNFFVRSTDLLAMANVNPDCAIGVQVQLEEPLTDQSTVCFQAALLYTSSRGDRRIRVHTLCLPVISDFSRVFHCFDIKASVSMLAKMAADRALNGGDISDCREALINAATDALATYNRSVGQRPSSILVPVEGHLKFLPLYVLGLLKNRAFSSAVQNVNIDQKVAAMLLFKTAPNEVIMLEICPALYSVHNIEECAENPQRLPLSYERVNRDGVYLLDTGSYVYMYVCSAVQPRILEGFFGVNSYSKLDEDGSLKQLENPLSERLHSFLRHLHVSRGLGTFAPVMIIREDSPRRDLFTKRLVEDRTESSHSYVEFLQHLKREISTN
ncbi:sec23/Sec24 trunk domain-containing protein [Ditylenchus destructor]|nr:sec23/Sec24 trunk domain-containing protein [Ditylenchus destructor]